MALQLRRGTNAERAAETFAVGELIYTTDTKQIYVGDGSTQGGVLVSSSAASSPASLTQNLSLNGFNISGTGNISATAFVGDGSGLTGIASGAGVEEGQEYAIDIRGSVIGDDSITILDAALGKPIHGNGSSLLKNSATSTNDHHDRVVPLINVWGPEQAYSLGFVKGEWK